MAETVRRLRIRVLIDGEVAGSDGTILPVNQSFEYNFQDGTGQNQLGTVYQDLDGSLATTTATIDLDGAANFQGATMSDNNQLKFALFKNESDAGNLIVGGGDFAGWFSDASDKLVVKPRGLFLIVAPNDGYTVTASTGDGLALETTATVAYKTILGLDNA